MTAYEARERSTHPSRAAASPPSPAAIFRPTPDQAVPVAEALLVNTGFDIRHRVRTATSQLHIDTENGIPVNAAIVRPIPLATDGTRRPPTDPEIKRALHNYGLYLLANLATERLFELAIDHTPLGREMFRRLGISPETPSASERIREDLAELGWKNLDARISRLPAPNLQFDDLLVMAGAHYVRTGSRMGGVMIAKTVLKNFGFDGTRCARFLNMHGKGTASHFDAFVRGFESLPRSEADVQKAIAGATAAFNAVGEIQGEAHLRLNWAYVPLRILKRLAATPIVRGLKRVFVEPERE